MSKPLVMIQVTALDGPFAGWIGPLPNPDLPPEVRRVILFALGADLAGELRAIAEEMDQGWANTQPPLQLRWSERIVAVAARLEE